MPIQVNRAVAAIEHELGSTLSPGLSPLEVVGAAYQELHSLKEGWDWAVTSAELDTVAGSAEVELPADFFGLVDSVRQDRTMKILRDEAWFEMKENGYVYEDDAAYFRYIEEASTGRKYLLNLNPFSASKVGRFWIVYEIEPVEVTEGTDSLPLPAYMHNLFLMLCRSYAKGWEESDDFDGVMDREKILASSAYAAAVRADNRKRARSRSSYTPMVRSVAHVFPFNKVAPVITPDGVAHYPN